ncbi:hypothetical protein PV326_005752 [Microctonus aethiopoides]|nr:hypothetical protein PV326_005752 [Microctonus aethiopoides]
MAGKPEQPISHPASHNHIHQQQQNYHQQHSLHLQQQQQQHHQQQHHHQHHHHQINRRNNQSNQQHNISQQQDTQGIQQNSVLVYVPGDNFAYTTAIEHNNAGGSTGGYQTSSQHQQHQQIPYQGVLPQVATQQTFPAKANYHVVTAQNIVGELDNDIDNGVDCCLGKSIDLIDCNILPSNKQQQQQNKDDDEYNSSNYRTSGLINGRATGSPSVVNKIDLGALSSSAIQNNNNTSNNNNITSAVRSPGQSDADSLSGISDSGIVATATSATRSALPSNAVIIGGGGSDNNNRHHHHQLHQQQQQHNHHQQQQQHHHLHHNNHQDNNKPFSQTHYNEITSCCGNSGYSISRLSDNFTANDGDTALNGVNENNLIANNTDENSRLTYVRHNGDVQLSTGIYPIGIDSQLQSQHHELIENKTRIIHQDSLDLNNRGCYINNNNTITNNTNINSNNNSNNDNSTGSNINNQVRGIEVGCESVRSDNGESVYSNSSLSSPECQNLQQSVGVDQGVSGNNNNNISGVVCAQQAAHLVSQINVQHSNNVALTMNGSVVTQHQQKQQHQHQQQQQQQTIAAPCGWKRICTNGVIIYIR